MNKSIVKTTLGNQAIYGANEKGEFVLTFNPAAMFRTADYLDFTGQLLYTDRKYKIIENYGNFTGKIVCNSDLIAHDSYIAKMKDSSHVILLLEGSEVSEKRIRRAAEKLKAEGIKVTIRKTVNTALKMVA